MPLLRRRGNTPSETNMRRQTTVEEADHIPTNSNAIDEVSSIANDQQSRASSASRPDTPPTQEETVRHKRFSMLRFRNASDSQLSLRAKQQAEKPPPVPRPPEIITTAPTGELTGPRKKPSRMSLAAAKLRRSNDISRDSDSYSIRSRPHNASRKSFSIEKGQPSLEPLEEPPSSRPSLQASANSNAMAPPPMPTRQSESSRSDASSNDRQSHPSPATTPRKSPASTPFFKMRKSKKPPEPLFPLSHLPQRNKTPPNASSSTSLNIAATPRPSSVHSGKLSRSNTDRLDGQASQRPAPSAAITLLTGGASRSGQSSPTRPKFLRSRSSTMNSTGGGRDSTDDHLLPPTTRTSSSTGRKSFGDIFGLSRIRQNSELSRQGTMTPATPRSAASHTNSLQLSRESISLPERQDDESPAKYLARVEEVLRRGIIAAMLSKGSDSFSGAVLRSYMRSFSFFGDPMDMAIRKLLMEAELPKETQHIDRCLQAFANRYHECNPGIYSSPDQAYFIAFSLLILHTDVFNKNNKYKMQKTDYLKNTRGEGVSEDVLDCFYDNITYTPFIHVEDELDLTLDRTTSKPKRKQILPNAGDPAKRALKEPIDPYTLIIDGNLDILRPNLKDAMLLEEHYNYLGTAEALNLPDLQKTFFRTGVLQIVSARSRPDAFMTDKTATNPEDAGPGIVDIKITKVGLLWRKDTKKRKTRSPWQEWGAILTGAQLYFFRNTGWVKNLMHQYEHHIKSGNDGIPIIFKPPLQEFKPDSLMSTHGAVALLDSSYKKHKNAFVYVRQGGLDEVLLADNEDEMNDWLAKLNYAAAFRTSGVRMRGVLGGNYDGQGRRGMRRLDSSDATQLVDTPSGQVSIARTHIDRKMVEDIQTARRNFMQQKIQEADEKVTATQKELDEQLRNARHLLILAPIQPKSRDQLLLSAAKMSAHLKWTRMEIWRERCHRDILKQDLEEDEAVPRRTLSRAIPLKSQPSQSSHRSPGPRLSISRHESKSKHGAMSDRSGHAPSELQLQSLNTSLGSIENGGSPDDQVFQTPPQSARLGPESPSEATHVILEESSTGNGSRASAAISPTEVQDPMLPTASTESNEAQESRNPSEPAHSHEDIDADERDFLRHAGLIEAKPSRDGSDRGTASTAGETIDQMSTTDREKQEKSKIRRSLQRTLREGAGHLSHNQSKRGRRGAPSSSAEESTRDSMLARGTGSFTVHGKKASVINFGSELQTLSADERLRTRNKAQQADQPLSPALSNGDDDEFYSVAGDLADIDDNDTSRRESAASASTATARSFRELHRKYSTARASRSVSHSRRLAIPSDGESEAAVSFSDGRRSPLPPIETEEDEEDGDDESSDEGQDSGVKGQGAKMKGETEDEEAGGTESQERGRLESRPVQIVNA